MRSLRLRFGRPHRTSDTSDGMMENDTKQGGRTTQRRPTRLSSWGWSISQPVLVISITGTVALCMGIVFQSRGGGPLLRFRVPTSTRSDALEHVKSISKTDPESLLPRSPFPRWGNNETDGFNLAGLLDAVNKCLSGQDYLVGREHSRFEMPSFDTVYVIRNGRDGPLELWKRSVSSNQSQIITDRARLMEPVLVDALTMIHEPFVPAVVSRYGGLVYVINYADSQFCNSDTNPLGADLLHDATRFPIFTLSAPWSSDCRYAMPIPTYETIVRATKRQASARKRLLPLSWDAWLWYPWYERVRRAVWRGSATGPVRHWTPPTQGSDETLYLRWNLVTQADQHRSWVNAKFVGGTTAASPHPWPARYNISHYLGESIDKRDYQRYRAVIDVDGNSWSSRLAELLCSSAVVLKVQPEYVDYFYATLEPWVHYIPVTLGPTDETSDLIPLVQFAVADENTRFVQTIIANANQWCNEKLQLKVLTQDMSRILDFYASLIQRHEAKDLTDDRRGVSNLFDRFEFSRVQPT